MKRPRRNTQILVRFTDEEITKLENHATQWGMSRQNFIRMILARTIPMIERGTLNLLPIEQPTEKRRKAHAP